MEPTTDENIAGYLPADDYNASLMMKDGAVERWIEDFFDYFSEDHEWYTRRLPDTITITACLLYTSPSPRDRQKSRMPSSA